MPYRAPGLDDDRLSWILIEVREAQATLDARIADARSLPETEPSKARRIIRLNQMKREVDNAFIQLDSRVRTWAERDIRSFYRQGHNVASAQLSAGFDFTLPHREALDLISFDAYDDVATRLLQVRSGFDTNVGLQKIFEGLDANQIATLQGRGRSAVTQALLTGEDPRKIARIFAQDIWKDGISIIDAGGRQWNPEKYTRMLLRTKTANAYNAGSMNKYAEEGVTRVRVFDGVLDDEECAEANGQIWSLRYGMNNVIQHPNCRRAFAPEQGDGPVNKDTAQRFLVKFDRLELGLGAVVALRAFRNTGELNVSSTLARLVIETGEILTGVNLPVIDVFLQGLVSGSFKNLDSWVESYVDPVLYASGLIRNVPPRAGLQASLRPQNVIDQITTTVKAANKEAFGVEFHPGVRAVLDRLDNAGARAVDALQSVGIGVGGEKHLDWIIRNGLNQRRFGEITAEVFRQVKNGNRDSLVDAWKHSAGFVDQARQIRSLYVRSAIATREQAEVIYQELDEILVQAVALLHHNVDIENLPAVLDFMNKYSRVNPVDVDRLLDFWTSQGRRIDFDAYEVRKLAEIFEAASIAQNRALLQIEEIDGALLRRGRRQLAMAAPSGPDFPTEVNTLWDIDQFNRTVDLMEDRLKSVVDGRQGVDPDVLTSFQELFTMLTFEESRILRDEFLKFEFIKPRFTDNLKGFVDEVDLNTPEKVFTFWADTLVELTIENNVLLASGDVVDDHLLSQIVEVLNWFDHERYFKFSQHLPLIKLHWEPQILGKHVSDLPLEGQGAVLGALWRNTLRDLGTVQSQAIVNPFQNLGVVLRRAYKPKWLSELGDQGVNGIMYKVQDPDTGMTVVIKRGMSTHAGNSPSVITSNVMSNFFAARLAGVENVPPRFISLTGSSEEVLYIYPFFEDSTMWSAAPDHLLREDSIRKFSLFDRLTMERDSHSRNFMVNQYTQTSVAIDRETGFALFMGQDLSEDFSFLGMQNAANFRLFERSAVAWRDGGDIRFLMNDPEVSLFRITKAEVEALSGFDPSAALVVSRSDMPAKNAFFRDSGIIFDDPGVGFIPTGRIGYVEYSGGLQFPEFHISHFLTETELKFVEDLVGRDNKLLNDAREAIEEAYKDLSTDTRITFLNFWTAQDFDDALDEAAAAVLEQAVDRAERLLRGGTINISGGLTKYADVDTGLELRYGTVVEFTDRNSGEIIEGLVVNLFEADATSGEISVVVLENIGLGKSASELAGNANPRVLNLAEWRFGPLIDETPRGKNIQYKSAIEEFQSPLVRDPTLFSKRLAPIIDQNGLHVGFQEETVDLDLIAGLSGRVTIRDPEGQSITLVMADFVNHPRFQELIAEEVANVPAQFRPKTIKVVMNKLSTDDGKAAFGLFHPETGELHISLAALLDNANISRVPGNRAAFYLDIDEPIDGAFTASGWVRDLDWTPVEEVFRHELGHAVRTGQERQAASRFAQKVFNQLQGREPAIKTLDDLEVFAGTLIPDGFDTTPFPTNVAALLAHRAGIMEDVANTNLVFDAKDLLESGLESGELPAWARAAYAGILREEVEAHHELYAEIWRRVINKGGFSGLDEVAEALGLPQGTKALRLESRERIFRFLNSYQDLELPREWDMGSVEFNRWLTDVLSPAATRIIPLERTANRRLWSAQRYSVPDIRVRVLRTAPEEGGGGITINLVTGNEPDTGFSVAKKSNERIFRNVTEDDEFDEIVNNYIQEFKHELEKPQWELGLWLDDDGTLYVDTVKVFDDEVDAAVFGFREGQRSMYHLEVGKTVNLLDDFADVDAYLVGRKIALDYEHHIAKTRKIGGVSRTTGTGEAKISEEFFEEGGTFRVMSMEWMTPKDRERVLSALSDRYTIPMTVEKGKANLIDVLERGLELFDEQPDLQEEFIGFYRRWFDTFMDASAVTVGRHVEIPVHRLAAAAAGMSASVDATVNLVTVVNMADIISRDLRMTSKILRETRGRILRSRDAAIKRLARAVELGNETKAAKETAYILDLEGLADSYKLGQKINLMDPRRRMRAIAGAIISEGRAPIRVPRQWEFYERSVAVLLGEMEPYQMLTDTKFRPFYNNIIDPGDIRNTREVTVDFIMMNAFFLSKGMDDLQTGTPVVQGIQAGLRPVISDTIRLLMDEGWGDRFGITTDLELQSLLWNLFRYGSRNEWWELETVRIRPRS